MEKSNDGAAPAVAPRTMSDKLYQMGHDLVLASLQRFHITSPPPSKGRNSELQP